ncbi:DUF2007 domain-containing protein [Parapusillimonas granuli]|uniref:DUF2007 domain-containing protein n=1 Tax=Parapusillimonas granuli TaxID=380911 RepID=A0A853FRU1_9BURK|nr:DUF2007 domain-containing protein [Parapusillimonas granuli]MBB5213708.1 hypothetical protein [Parapusillimonas granuli]MEB2398799.1 DUF2007 domain-containing protein [Alcaligenaceae bacterium]NYT48545.1 DUF2007 domain-containing protein [Parapusillimonas granuli]
MQIVYRAADILEAHIVSGMLTANGIEAYVAGHYLQGAVGDLPPLGFAHVSVADDDVEAAMALIREYESGANQADEHAADGGG